jgi:diguanylate cyclase (GGDEF)-like protein
VHLNTVASLIALERAGRHDEAIRRIRAGENRHRIEAIMREIDKFETIERTLLVERTEAARRASAQDSLFEYLVCAVGLAMVGVATVAAVALRRSLLREAVVRAELRRIAVTDELTGLANRREILHALDWLIGAARRSGRPLSVAVLDIDHFKRVNDVHGHPAGDEVIRRVAHLAVEIMRDQDLVGRLGGEEFVIAMPNTDLEHARLACERLRLALGELSILLPTGSAVAVTLSTGVTQFSGSEDRTQLIARADEALYSAKQQGRNRVLLAA